MQRFQADVNYIARRSPVLGKRGAVASSQPLASQAGLRILQNGGTAADAAVAMAAALNVLEPASTGLGGDAFLLYFDAAKQKVHCLLGAGKAPAGLTLDTIRQAGITSAQIPQGSPLAVTVPGAPALWDSCVDRWGALSLAQVVAPAIELAEGGFPVGPITAHAWEAGLHVVKAAGGKGMSALVTPQGAAPKMGEVMSNLDLGRVLRRLGEKGAKEGFYQGPVADAIVKELQSRGGVMTASDLMAHETQEVEPISTVYRDHTIWEVPPPTHGIAALLALSYVEADGNLSSLPWGSPQHLHRLVEAMRCGFCDALQHVADPEAVRVPVGELLDAGRVRERRRLTFDEHKAAVLDIDPLVGGDATGRVDGGDTVYLCAVDGEGNACSFINSTYMPFGTGIVPEGCGFTLQNRGGNFTLDPSHPNCVAPGKRPYHTIIPAMATRPDGSLMMAFGVMGAFMQPQGHLQVVSNILDYNMDPQAALDAPRFILSGVNSSVGPASVRTSKLQLEAGFPEETVKQLAAMGHEVQPGVDGFARSVFGKGQVILRDPDSGVLWAGSEPRSDGMAIAY